MVAKKTTQRQGFKTNEFIVYPAHGVGQIMAIEEQEVAGCKLELFVINFVKDKMTLRVPTAKIAAVGMRKLAEPPIVKRALETLKGRARIKRTMWSRRAQEYEAKINSGNIVSIAEVVRDLYRSDTQPEQSTAHGRLRRGPEHPGDADAGLRTRDADAETAPWKNLEHYRTRWTYGRSPRSGEAWLGGGLWLLDLMAAALAGVAGAGRRLRAGSGLRDEAAGPPWRPSTRVPAPVVTAAPAVALRLPGLGGLRQPGLSALRSKFGGDDEKAE